MQLGESDYENVSIFVVIAVSRDSAREAVDTSKWVKEEKKAGGTFCYRVIAQLVFRLIVGNQCQAMCGPATGV